MQKSGRVSWLVLVVLTSVVGGCGPGPQVIDTTNQEGGSVYDQQCRRAVQQQQTKSDKGKYQAQSIEVLDGPWSTAGSLVNEQALAEGLAQGKLRRAALYARAGLGKTSLMGSLRAQLCNRIQVFVADAKAVAADGSSGNPLQAVLAKGDTAGWSEATRSGKGKALILLDALDEVDVRARPRVAEAVAGLLGSLPQAQLLVLARPPVAEADYGLAGIETHLSLRPLSCETVDGFFAEQVRDPDQRTSLLAWLSQYKLVLRDERSGQCHYPALASWSDANQLLDFFRTAVTPGSQTLIHHSAVHQVLIGARLRKELEGMQWDVKRVMGLVDSLVGSAIQPGQGGTLTLDNASCLAAIEWQGLQGDRSPAFLCERLWQSPLFVPAAQAGRFEFAHRGTQDLFVARWLDQQIGGAGPDCKAAIHQTNWLKDGEVFTFLVGQPNGARCVMPLLDDRCSRDPKSDQAGPLNDGLPVGRPRQRIVDEMKAGYEATTWKYCTRKTLQAIADTAPPR